MNRAIAGALLLLGVLQMAGDLLERRAVKAIAAATAASPAPRVFSAVRGLETYSTRFLLEWTDRDGQTRNLALTPAVYARLAGPYNRRNAYGVIVAFGPILATQPETRPMFVAVSRYALCDAAPLLVELGIDPRAVVGSVRVRLEPRDGATLGDLPRVLETSCP